VSPARSKAARTKVTSDGMTEALHKTHSSSARNRVQGIRDLERQYCLHDRFFARLPIKKHVPEVLHQAS